MTKKKKVEEEATKPSLDERYKAARKALAEPENPSLTKRELAIELEIENWQAGMALTPEAQVVIQRRNKQAEALWQMYRRGDVTYQTLMLPVSSGGFLKKRVLYSHHSHYAV